MAFCAMVSLGGKVDPIIGFACGSCFAATSCGMSAKILQDFNQQNSDFGSMIITVAMIDDVLSLVLLSIVTQLTDDIKPVKIIIPIFGSIFFTLVLSYYAIKINPKVIKWFKLKYLSIDRNNNNNDDDNNGIINNYKIDDSNHQNVPSSSNTNINNITGKNFHIIEKEEEKEEKISSIEIEKKFQKFGIYFLTIIAFAFGMITATLSTELLGVFLAGVAFSSEPSSQKWWHQRGEKITSIGTMFFFCSMGMEVPLKTMLNGKTFGLGILLTIPAIVGKTLPSIIIYGCSPEGAVVGQGLACWGEIAFLIAKISYDNGVFGKIHNNDYYDDYSSSKDETNQAQEILAVLIWALLIGTSLMPIIFPIVLRWHLQSNIEEIEEEEKREGEYYPSPSSPTFNLPSIINNSSNPTNNKKSEGLRKFLLSLHKLKNGNKKLNCSRHKKNDSVIEMEENTPSTTMSTV